VIIRADESSPMPLDRVLEYTAPKIAGQLRNEFGTPDFDKLSVYPTITVPEFRPDDTSVMAQIGYLASASLNVHLDPVIITFPAIILWESGIISNWENTRTHWAVRSGDPYKIIGKGQLHSIPSAVIQFPKTIADRNKLAVMMPFDKSYLSPDSDPVYSAIKEAATAKNLLCLRADELNTPTDITNDIFQMIEESYIVIVDLSGRNPNVLYEMGVAHARGRVVIPISRDDETLPFDIGHIRTIHYHFDSSGLQGLTTQLGSALESVLI
jgi:hypothetical protein